MLHFKYFGATESSQHGPKKAASSGISRTPAALIRLLQRRRPHTAPTVTLGQLKDSATQPAGGLASASRGQKLVSKLQTDYVRETGCFIDYPLHDAISTRCHEKASLDKQRAEGWLPGAESAARRHVGSFGETVWNWIVAMTAQLCECTKNHRIYT